MKINFIEYWINTVKKHPEKIAVIEENHIITINELNNLAKKISNEINFKSNGTNKPVAVLLPKSINSISANIAIMYSGCFYVNIDIKSPLNRIKEILDTISPEVIITDSSFIENINQITSNIINIDLISTDIENFTTNHQKLIDTDPMCIINTSGSTGIPKGVVLSHRSFIDFFEWATTEFNFDSNDVIGSLSPLVFDIYSFELTLLMGKGSTIVLIPEMYSTFPIKILDVLEKEKVSFIFWVPTIMVNIANLKLLDERQYPELKLVWFAGEVFPTKQFNYWYRNIPNTQFVNMYGPIEITLDCTFYRIDKLFNDDESIPIGKPCRNTGIIVLDENNRSIQSDADGELCIRGSSLAMGYFNNIDITNKAFIQNPLNPHYPEIIYKTGDIVSFDSDGNLIYKGRKDTMIKHSGYRIELAEIEHATVNRMGLVKNCCVIYNGENKEIILIYENDVDIEIAFFRKKLATYLPKYMIPSVFIRVKELPMNTNGKIDRLKIREDLIK
jgi:amino acid adenylation domain-containing protein